MDEADWSDLMAWDVFDPVYELAVIDNAVIQDAYNIVITEVESEQEA